MNPNPPASSSYKRLGLRLTSTPDGLALQKQSTYPLLLFVLIGLTFAAVLICLMFVALFSPMPPPTHGNATLVRFGLFTALFAGLLFISWWLRWPLRAAFPWKILLLRRDNQPLLQYRLYGLCLRTVHLAPPCTVEVSPAYSRGVWGFAIHIRHGSRPHWVVIPTLVHESKPRSLAAAQPLANELAQALACQVVYKEW